MGNSFIYGQSGGGETFVNNEYPDGDLALYTMDGYFTTNGYRLTGKIVNSSNASVLFVGEYSFGAGIIVAYIENGKPVTVPCQGEMVTFSLTPLEGGYALEGKTQSVQRSVATYCVTRVSD